MCLHVSEIGKMSRTANKNLCSGERDESRRYLPTAVHKVKRKSPPPHDRASCFWSETDSKPLIYRTRFTVATWPARPRRGHQSGGAAAKASRSTSIEIHLNKLSSLCPRLFGPTLLCLNVVIYLFSLQFGRIFFCNFWGFSVVCFFFFEIRKLASRMKKKKN